MSAPSTGFAAFLDSGGFIACNAAVILIAYLLWRKYKKPTK